jgi:hypothetical protein
MISNSDPWPDYLPGPREHLKAVGTITLIYGTLEGQFQWLLASVTALNDIQISAIFQRVTNDIRLNILTDIMAKTALPDELKEAIKHFMSWFSVCVENRNGLMHSRSGGMVLSQNDVGFLFTKFSRSGNRLVCSPSLIELRAVADSMHEFMLYASRLIGDVKHFQMTLGADKSRVFSLSPSSQKKPPLPAGLRWQHEADFQADRARQKSFRL